MKHKNGQVARNEEEEMEIWTQHLKESFSIETTEEARFWETEAWRSIEEKGEKVVEGPAEETGWEEEIRKVMERHKSSYIQKAVEGLTKNETVLFGDFTQEELDWAIKKVENNKAAGEDQIPNEI